MAAIILTAAAAFIPILAQIYTIDGKPVLSSAWATVALVLALSMVMLDHFFGFSSAWMLAHFRNQCPGEMVSRGMVLTRSLSFFSMLNGIALIVPKSALETVGLSSGLWGLILTTLRAQMRGHRMYLEGHLESSRRAFL